MSRDPVKHDDCAMLGRPSTEITHPVDEPRRLAADPPGERRSLWSKRCCPQPHVLSTSREWSLPLTAVRLMTPTATEIAVGGMRNPPIGGFFVARANVFYLVRTRPTSPPRSKKWEEYAS